MAQPANLVDSYDIVGMREDLSDEIYNVSPTEVPVQTAIGRTKVSNPNHEWQTDALRAATASGARLAGDDATLSARTATTRLGNRVETRWDAIGVSDDETLWTKAGRAEELDYQVMKTRKELQRDLEMVITDNGAAVVGNSTTPAEMAGIPAWLTSNVSRGVGGASGNGLGTTAATDGTPRAFTETLFRTVLTSIFDQGGNPDRVFLTSAQQNIASGFVGRANAIDQAKAGEVAFFVDTYKTAFNTVTLIPTRFMRAREVLILESNYWKLGVAQNWERVSLGKTGDNTRVMVRGRFTLEARNQASSGIVADLT